MHTDTDISACLCIEVDVCKCQREKRVYEKRKTISHIIVKLSSIAYICLFCEFVLFSHRMPRHKGDRERLKLKSETVRKQQT